MIQRPEGRGPGRTAAVFLLSQTQFLAYLSPCIRVLVHVFVVNTDGEPQDARRFSHSSCLCAPGWRLAITCVSSSLPELCGEGVGKVFCMAVVVCCGGIVAQDIDGVVVIGTIGQLSLPEGFPVTLEEFLGVQGVCVPLAAVVGPYP